MDPSQASAAKSFANWLNRKESPRLQDFGFQGLKFQGLWVYGFGFRGLGFGGLGPRLQDFGVSWGFIYRGHGNYYNGVI